MIRNNTERSSILNPVSLNANILQNCYIKPQPGYWLDRFHPPYSRFPHLYSLLYVYLAPYNFITHVGLCIQHHSQDTEQPYYSRDLSCYSSFSSWHLWMWIEWLNVFIMAAVTECHKLGDFNLRSELSTVLRAKFKIMGTWDSKLVGSFWVGPRRRYLFWVCLFFFFF